MPILILILFVFFSQPVQASSFYTVENIAVDVEADNAIEARDKALNQARRNAFNIMTGRIMPGGADTPKPEANDDSIASMVDHFEINREKLSKNRYLASVNVTFSENALKGFFARHNMAMQKKAAPAAPVNPDQPPQQNTANPFGTTAQQPYPQQAMTQPTLAASNVTLQVPISNLRQWINLQQRLRTIPMVQAMTVDSLNASQAIITLSYLGQVQELQNDLSTRGLGLFRPQRQGLIMNETSPQRFDYVLGNTQG